ncbi:MAG: carbohydrate binding domain-containing protein [Oscillospiraceae bacterium]|nr:carbohydrate binding domain-containing protein [Oscillospiraceae bacterium]
MRTRNMTAALAALLCTALIPAGALPAGAVDGAITQFDFEQSLSDWAGRGAASVALSADQHYAGAKSLYCSGRTASWNGAAIPLDDNTVQAGQTYSFSAEALYPTGEDADTFYLSFQYKDTAGEPVYDHIAMANARRGEWVQLENTAYQIPAGATDMYLYVEMPNGKGDFYLDDVVIAQEGIKVDGAGQPNVRVRTSAMTGDINGDGTIDVFDLALFKRGLLRQFENKYDEQSADADNNGTVEVIDYFYLVQYIHGMRTEFPEPPEPPKPQFNYDPALAYHEAPSGYLDPCSQAGTITKETYTGIRGTKSLNVYTPYGYDPSKQYNIFYLMHGGGENENTIFSDDVKLGRILDHMIMNGELEPLIVVTPTFNGSGSEAGNFWDEFRQNVAPFVESKYSTYAKSGSLEDLRASRMHRAYGGFSMGALSTWCVADHDMDIVGYFMPLSGNNWEGMGKLTGEIDSLGLKQNEYFIFAATGSKDLAYGNMRPEMEDLKTKTQYFTYTSDFSKGNYYFLVADGNVHWWGQVRHYVYDALPYFFHEGS